MKRKNLLSAIRLLVLFLVASSIIYSQFFQGKADETLKKIIMIVTLPDSTTFKATVAEEGELVITKDDKYYRFVPTITDAKMKIAHMNAVEVLSLNANDDDLINSIQFEIIDIVSDHKRFQRKANCSDGRCCVSCNGWTACACAVEFEECSKSCCCFPCCPKVPIE
ncbi:MAG: hypothetical protein GTO45_35235 [Candidatus Aminicenantes bacterium]|nr:hypothetical protein [Candidatus Aminicenantes bacterium]NIM83940.1 hypothetical protein [Candidatus Aminicenantes bacterium]NIN23409.1 hypothetical protein [Candidatus Aminicenantes bacterium]NIN47113.1 hypothetical protein [Candidatus Aminicenantes bacterium]NIN90037.1 hypothetical protein [Candidatus Aminicenantes bacterium]